MGVYETVKGWGSMQIRFAALALLVLFAGLFAFTSDQAVQAATTLPTKMNFQGRITNASGTTLANGTYNMKFRIWSAASAGTQLWSEDRLVSASQGVTVTNGQFSVQLGSVTSLPASVFASNSLYFEVELPTPASATTSSPVWTEGAMTPRNQLATSAYAYNSETLDGLDSAAFGQLDQNNVFTGNNTFNGTIQGGSSLTLGTSSVQGSLVLNDGNGQTGTLRMADIAGNYTYTIPVTTANDTFCLQSLANCASGSGITTVGSYSTTNTNANGATISGSSIIFQNASATAPGMVGTGTQTFAGNKTFTGTVTLNDNVTVAANKTIQFVGGATSNRPGSPSEGTMYYDTDTKKMEVYTNGKWQADRNNAVLIAASNSSQADKDAADFVADGNTASAADGDQVQINSALTAAAGKTVYLLPGTYTIDAPISMPSGSSLTGNGVASVITVPNALTGMSRLIQNSNNGTTTGNADITISNVVLDGNMAGGGDAKNGIDYTANGSNTTALRSLRVTGVLFKNIGNYGIYSEAYKSVVSNNTFDIGTNGGAVYQYLGGNNTISNNKMVQVGNAVFLYGSNDNQISDNVVDDSTYAGFDFEESDRNFLTGNRVTITSPGSSREGMILRTGADSNIVTNNFFYNTLGTTDSPAIYVTAGSNNYFANNTLGGRGFIDNGTNTVKGGQLDGSGNYVVQPAGTIQLAKDTTVSTGSLTLGTASTSGALKISDGSSNTATIVAASTAGDYTYTIPVTTANDTFCLKTLVNCATVMGTLDAGTASATGASIVGSSIYLQSASTSFAGLINTTTQSFAGNKTFTGTVTISGTTTLNDNVTVAAGKTIQFVGSTTASRPASPGEGTVYYDTDTKKLQVFSNGKWQADRTDAVLVAASNSSQADKDAADFVADGNTVAASDGDQIQIQSALNAGAGKKVVLLAGTYTADATILVPNNTTLSGVGRGTIIEFGDIDVTDNLIENTDASTGTGVTIQDMQIDGRKDLNTAGTQNGIYLYQMGSGTGASARQGGTVRGVLAKNFSQYGIQISTSSNNVLTGNTALANNSNGIFLHSGSNNVASNNNAQGNATGIALSIQSNSTVSGNSVQGNTSQGISIFTSDHNMVTGNILEGNPTGFYVSSAANNNLTGNTVRTSTANAFSLSLNANYTVISGNRVADSGGTTTNNAITVANSDYVSVTGNVITDSSATTNNYAINISVSTSDATYLSNNTLGTGSINDLGTGTIYASQVDASGNLTIQPAANINLNKNTVISSGSLTLGNASTAGNLVISDGSSNTATIVVGNLAGNYTYSIPVTTANDTFCLVTLGNCAGAGSGVTTVGALDGGSANANGATITGTTIYLQSASATNSGLINTVAQTIAGNKTFTGNTLVQPTTDSDSVFEVKQNAGLDILTVDTETTVDPLEVQIGSNSAIDTTQVNLSLDSSSQFTDQGTCGTSTNQGSIYFNTSSQSIRTCVNGGWEDIVTTSGLGLILFGVVPDGPATTGTGDLAGAGGYNSGPCKVYLTATQNIIGWNSCIAYTNGRKVLVSAGTATVSASTSVFQNLCLNTSGTASLIGTANATETTSTLYPSFTVASPTLCLATIKTGTAANRVQAIYDTRVYTTSTKSFATLATAAPLGAMVKSNGTIGQYAPTTAITEQIAGVVVAFSGTTSTTAPNAIIVTNGPVAVKASAGTAGAIIKWGAAGGYGLTVAAATTATNPYVNAGVALNSYSGVAAGCTASTVCNGSLFTNLSIN